MIVRDNRIDTIKGVLIVLVILGHLIGQCGEGDGINRYVRTFIYTFHMPLFILVSGYLSNIKKDRNVFLNSLMRIAIPLAIFQIVNVFLLLLFKKHVGCSVFVVPYWTLWYLLSLIFWRIMLQFSPKKLLDKPYLYLSIAILISIVCGLMPHGRVLSIQRTLNFYPFFLLGYYIKQMGFISKPWGNWRSMIFLFIIIALIIGGAYPEKCGVLQRGADHYDWSRIPAKIYMLVCSCVASLSIFNIVKENKILASIGKDSLLYYLYHGIIIQFVAQPIIQHFGLSKSFFFMLLYCVITVVLIYLLSNTNLCRWLVNPVTKK